MTKSVYVLTECYGPTFEYINRIVGLYKRKTVAQIEKESLEATNALKTDQCDCQYFIEEREIQ